jgi:hypothetical protein
MCPPPSVFSLFSFPYFRQIECYFLPEPGGQLLTHSITGGIMNKRDIARLREELGQLRTGKYSLKRSDLISVAERIGRKLSPHRGKHPM